MMMERAAVGAAIRSEQDLEVLLAICTPEDMSDSLASRTLRACASLLAEEMPVNLATVSDRGGLSAHDLHALYDDGRDVRAEDIERMARRISSDARQRRFSRSVRDIASKTSAFAELEGALAKLLEEAQAGEETVTDAASACHSVAFDAAARAAGEKPADGVSTRIPSLDRYTAGLKAGLYVIGGRPAMGKSCLAQNILENVVLSNETLGGLYFSLEMTREEVGQRTIARFSGFSEKTLRTGIRGHTAEGAPIPLSEDDIARIYGAAKRVPHDRYAVEDSKYTIGEILAATRAHKARMGRRGVKLQVVVVDYLQLVESSEEEAGTRKVTRALKKMSKNLDVTVIALTQLNRSLERRDNKEPMLADIRGEDGGGSIEQDANVVIFVHRPVMFDDGADPREAVAILAKNRGGETGKVRLNFEGKRLLFHEPGMADQ